MHAIVQSASIFWSAEHALPQLTTVLERNHKHIMFKLKI